MLLTLAAAGIPACGGCEDDSSGRVPFPSEPPNAPNRDTDSREDAPPFQPTKAQVMPEGTARVAVQGAPLEVATGSIRALLPLDVDEDGDRDALLVRVGEQGEASMEFARREGNAFRTVRSIGALTSPGEGCKVAAPSLRTMSPSYAILSLKQVCDQVSHRTLAILGLGDTPEILERITLLPEEGRTLAEVTLAVDPTDVDGDGHQDVVLEVTAQPPEASESARVRLPWLDRPAGLARDQAEPEKTLADLADRALEALPEDPEAALELARRAVTLHGVLCREGGGPRLQFGEGGGLTCGRSTAAGRAVAVQAAAQARTGNFFEALEAEQRFSRPGYAVGDGDRKRLDRAWDRAPVPDGLEWRKVAAHRPGAMPDVHLPAVTFSDPDTLLLRGGSPQVVDLTTGEARAAADASGPGLIRDPSGDLAVVDVHRTCEGYALSIVDADEVVAGVVAGRPKAEPLIETKAPPADARCPKLPASVRNDTGGWQVLGWAPQGVVAVRGRAIRVVPLTAEGKPAGEPSSLEPGTPPPAPLPPGQATPDGRAYVVGSRHGVLLRRLPSGPTLLLRPEGWTGDAQAPSDVAVAPDANKVAVLRDENVWVIEGLP